MDSLLKRVFVRREMRTFNDWCQRGRGFSILTGLFATTISAGWGNLSAQDAFLAGPTKQWSVRDLLLAPEVREITLSADGALAAWTFVQMDEEDGFRTSEIWITNVSTRESRRLATERSHDSMLRWHPTEQKLAFVRRQSDEEHFVEETSGRIFLADMAIGSVTPWTESIRDLRGFAWAQSENRSLVVWAKGSSELSSDEGLFLSDAVVVEDPGTTQPIRLWAVDRETAELHPIADDPQWVEEAAVSPDGRWAAVLIRTSLHYDYNQSEAPVVQLVNLNIGRRTDLDLGDRIVARPLQWSPDGKGFFYAYSISAHPVYHFGVKWGLGYYNMYEDENQHIGLAHDFGLSEDFRVQATNSGVFVQLADGISDRLEYFSLQGKRWQRTPVTAALATNPGSWGIDPGAESIVFLTSAADQWPKLFVGELRNQQLGELHVLRNLHPAFAGKPKPRVEVVRWTGANQEEVEGLLHFPLDYKEDHPYALILDLHDGPADRFRNCWKQDWNHPSILLNQKGAFVFQPNFHGSLGYGLKWADSLAGGKLLTLPLQDVENGVQSLIDQNKVDPKSIAVRGWGYGGLLATALIASNPQRYRAAIVGAGMVDFMMNWGPSRNGQAFSHYYAGSHPWEGPAIMQDLSPFWTLDDVRSPTLIFFGDRDPVVNPVQGWTLFRALQHHGKAEVRFVIFPGEGHQIEKFGHQRKLLEEELRWLDLYLLGSPL